MSKSVRMIVHEEARRARIDVFLSDHVPWLTRSQAQRLVRDGKVSVNGTTMVRPSTRLEPGDAIVVELPPAVDPLPQAVPIPINVVYEDDHLAIVDKPAGLTVHPGPGHARDTLVNAKILQPESITKSGLMVGLGEDIDEVKETMRDIRSWEVDILTLGQYLQPSKNHLPVDRFYTPEEFDQLKEYGLGLGFKWVESAPLVRSSYHAAEQARLLSPRFQE